VEETAEVLQVSTDPVKRDWRLANLWRVARDGRRFRFEEVLNARFEIARDVEPPDRSDEIAPRRDSDARRAARGAAVAGRELTDAHVRLLQQKGELAEVLPADAAGTERSTWLRAEG